MTDLTFTVPGELVSWQRNRIGRSGRPIRDEKGKAYRAAVATLARVAMGRNRALRGLQAPFSVSVVAVYPRPAKRPPVVPGDVWSLGCRVYRRTETGPDADRIAGHILDGMKDAGVYVDDGVVTRLEVVKVWAAVGERPCAEVSVSVLGWAA